MTGTIKSIKSDKGYGFIRSKDTEYFFHRDDLIDSHWNDLVEDYERHESDIKVEFEETHGKKGPRAASIRRIE